MKPHIKKVNGEWDCEGLKSNNPKNAYFMWQFRVVKKEEYERLVNELRPTVRAYTNYGVRA